MNTSIKRLIREENQARRTWSRQLLISRENEREWRAFLQGPPDSPFAGTLFELQILISEDYPLSPPKVHFLTPIFHPNVKSGTGEVCIDILKQEHWTPGLSIENVCRAIGLLLETPNPDSPLNCDAGNLLRSGDKLAYEQMVRLYATEYGVSVQEYRHGKLKQQ